MKKICLLLVLFICRESLYAQSTAPVFGIYTEAERGMKECAFDKDADAVILLDEAFSNYDDQYHLIINRRTRIKILNQRGIEHGAITIPFYTKDGAEFIKDIHGVTYTPDENPSSIELSGKSIYTEKIDDKYSAIRFAMPNVKVGSIIEYEYETVMNNYRVLQDWEFQADLPTVKSSFRMVVRPDVEFSYVVSKKSNYPVIIDPPHDNGMIYFEMNNIPGLRREPYMDARKDYLQRVEFQLSGYMNSLGTKESLYSTWKDVALRMATDGDLSIKQKRTLDAPDDLRAKVEQITSASDKIAMVYNFVRDNFTLQGDTWIEAPDGLEAAWQRRSGSCSEINLILVNLLKSFKIEAYPIVVADREHGKINPAFPLIDRFNKTVAYALDDGVAYIMDASQKYCPFGLTPSSLLNTYALLINRKTDKPLFIETSAARFSDEATVNIKMDVSGNITGQANIRSMDYAKEYYTEKIKNDPKKYVRDDIEEVNAPIKVSNMTYENLTTDTADLLQHFEFRNQVDATGGFLLLNVNLFTGLRKNVFGAPERFSNVDFGYPIRNVVDETIELPAGCTVDELPKSKAMMTPDKNIIIVRKIEQEGQLIKVKLDFQQTITIVEEKGYDNLREFYKQMVDMLNEPIVIKINK